MEFPFPKWNIIYRWICSHFQLNLSTHFPINQNDWYFEMWFIWLRRSKGSICGIQISFSVFILWVYSDIIQLNGVNISKSLSANVFGKKRWRLSTVDNLLVTQCVCLCPVLRHCHPKCGRHLCWQVKTIYIVWLWNKNTQAACRAVVNRGIFLFRWSFISGEMLCKCHQGHSRE